MEAGEEAISPVMLVMADAFAPEFGEAWTESQLRSMVGLPSTRLYVARLADSIGGFCFTRHAGDEEEILLVAVSRAARRNGVASALIHHAMAIGRCQGRTRMFLEMRQGNDAEFLYEKMGFQIVGRRPAYYRGIDGKQFDALTMAADII